MIWLDNKNKLVRLVKLYTQARISFGFEAPLSISLEISSPYSGKLRILAASYSVSGDGEIMILPNVSN